LRRSKTMNGVIGLVEMSTPVCAFLETPCK
jgi:hypothetical protein